MNEPAIIEPQNPLNTPEKVKFRHGILMLQALLEDFAKQNNIDASPEKYPLRHYFTPVEERCGFGMYAREAFYPKGEIIIGLIHRHPHLNFLMKGKIAVATETGRQIYEAPTILVSSDIGVKKAGYVLEDTIWVCVQLAQSQDVESVEKEVIANNYLELGLDDGMKLIGEDH